MPLYLLDNKLLVNDGKLAIHENCCCASCDDFPACLGPTFDLTISGLVNDSISVEDCEGLFCGYSEIEILWANFNGSYQLQQDPFQLNHYTLSFGSCSDVASAIQTANYTYCQFPETLSGHFISGITVIVSCDTNEMTFGASWGGFAMPLGVSPCGGLVGTPLPHTCATGAWLNRAAACTSQTMKQEVTWKRPEAILLGNGCPDVDIDTPCPVSPNGFLEGSVSIL